MLGRSQLVVMLESGHGPDGPIPTMSMDRSATLENGVLSWLPPIVKYQRSVCYTAIRDLRLNDVPSQQNPEKISFVWITSP
jgi:hypothetical protein